MKYIEEIKSGKYDERISLVKKIISLSRVIPDTTLKYERGTHANSKFHDILLYDGSKCIAIVHSTENFGVFRVYSTFF